MQNSASNRKWLTMAEKRALTCALLSAPDLVDGGAHVVVDPAPRHAAQHAEGVVVGVEQHLMRLLRVGPENEGATVGELDVGDLQFGPLARDDRPILRPVELERFAGQETPEARKRRGHRSAAPDAGPPSTRERRPPTRLYEPS